MADTETRQKLAAIVAADAVGFSRLMGTDAQATLAELDANRALFRLHTEQHGGRIVDMAGDSVLAVFASAAAAVRAAVAAQAAVEERGAGIPEKSRLRYRVGVNLGEIIEKSDGSIYGDGVNVAARLQSLAETGGVLLSAKVHDEVQGQVGVALIAAGEHKLKNIARPLRTYRVLPAGEEAPVTGEAAESEPVRALEAPPPLPDRPSIVVLPFDNMSGDKEQEYFADGITEDIITDISQVSGMFVIARNSSFTYKGKAVNVSQVGRELGVKNVLEGSVRKSGNRIRITAQLIDAATGGHIWAQRYDRDLNDIFAVQDEVTREIVNVLRVKLTGEDKARIAARPTADLQAYEIFLRGRDLFWRGTREAVLESRGLFADAIAIDARFADAVAMLGLTYVLDYINRWTDLSESALDHADDLSARAIELDETRIYPHFVRSIVYLWRRELDAALAEDDRCRELDPNFPYHRSHRGSVLLYMGRPAEAIEHITEAMRLDPLTPDLYLHFLGQCHFALGDDEETERVLRQRITRFPNTDISRVLLAASLGHLGRTDERAASGRVRGRSTRAIRSARSAPSSRTAIRPCSIAWPKAWPRRGSTRIRERSSVPPLHSQALVSPLKIRGGDHGWLRDRRYE